jgi:urease accessory protein
MDPITLLSLMARTRTPAERADVLEERTVDYCRERLRSVTRVEAATAVVARAVALNGGPLTSVADLWWARTSDPFVRGRNSDLGEVMLALAGREPRHLPRAVVVGMFAAETGIEPRDLARMVGYDDVQGVLVSVPLAQATACTAELFADIIEVADEVAGLTQPLQIPVNGTAVPTALAQ